MRSRHRRLTPWRKRVLEAQIVVLAKEPRPGRVKTRLTPPLTPQQAADVAAAALHDTLDAVRATPVAHRLLVLDGSADRLDTTSFGVHPQSAGGLDVRLAAAFRTAYDANPLPTLLVGMDTPQLTPALLTDVLELLLAGTGAVLGAAQDGGWWALGLHRPDDRLLVGVPMSSPDTGRHQRQRLDEAGLTVADLPVLRDIDEVADLLAVAELIPTGRLAGVVNALSVAA